MVDISTYKRVYFIGIGGIGMSALARYFVWMRYDVAGYDKTPSGLTEDLEREGMTVVFEEAVNAIPLLYRSEDQKSETLVVYTPAIPTEQPQLKYFAENGYALHKRAEILAAITEGKTTIAVAGTHGKTSTAAIISHILAEADVPFMGFLGGIASNYNTNFISSTTREANLCVVEADEYDKSFLRLSPDFAIVTAIESDHLDIYGDYESLRATYYEFMGNVKDGGMVIAQVNIPKGDLPGRNWVPYSVSSDAEVFAKHVRIGNGKFYFDFHNPGLTIREIEMGVPGLHNIENSLAAITAVLPFVKKTLDIKKALATFKGVKRRFEVIYNEIGSTYVDDYAHHPTEIDATISTIKKLFPNASVTGLFQPHLFSRTRDLADEFAASLSKLDRVYLLPIYPAREEPIPGVTSEMILDKITAPEKFLVSKEKFLEEVRVNNFKVLLTIGAGDIDRLVKPIAQLLQLKNIENEDAKAATA
ncbi:MAG: UDP-N-acetylmuramate--L-alanine ligase [Bacteroidota bacterium]|nr:UDP-N-acetylmuramate--L-alanine ligase [Bacteroidota bacterium]